MATIIALVKLTKKNIPGIFDKLQAQEYIQDLLNIRVEMSDIEVLEDTVYDKPDEIKE